MPLANSPLRYCGAFQAMAPNRRHRKNNIGNGGRTASGQFPERLNDEVALDAEGLKKLSNLPRLLKPAAALRAFLCPGKIGRKEHIEDDSAAAKNLVNINCSFTLHVEIL